MELLRTVSTIGMVGITAVTRLIAAFAAPRWAAAAVVLESSRHRDALSAALMQGMRSALPAAIPPLAIAWARSLVRGRAKAQPV